MDKPLSSRLRLAFAEDAMALASWQEQLGDRDTASQLRQWARGQFAELRGRTAVAS